MTCPSLGTFKHPFFAKILFSLCYFFGIPQNEFRPKATTIRPKATTSSPTLFPFSRIPIKPKTGALLVK